MKQKTRTFLKPDDLLLQAGLDSGETVADFGCGNGYYAIAAAKIVGPAGQVFALDVLEKTLSQTSSQAKLENAYNVSTILCDLEQDGCPDIEDQSVDLVILSSLLHQVEKKEAVLREAYRVLKTGGRLLVVEWNETSPLGPPRAERVSEKEARLLLEKMGLRPSTDISAGSFHYAILYNK